MTQSSTHTTAPYNPWQSYIVEASAGSGKTWQLSRRFLALVIAGADPASILTVTFTKKAAAEMRERIVKDAVRLGQGHEEFATLCDEIKQWRPADSKELGSIRTPFEASRLILEKTQTLKITTIDSIFLQWTQRFPLETAIVNGADALQTPWDILSNLSYEKLTQKAWRDVLAMHDDHDENIKLMESIALNAPDGKISSLEGALKPLNDNHTFLWYIQLLGRTQCVGTYEIPEVIETIEDFIQTHQEALLFLVGTLKTSPKKQESIQAIHDVDIKVLLKHGILRTDLSALNGNTFRGAKSSSPDEFNSFNDLLRQRLDMEKLNQLNHSAQLIWTLFQAISTSIHKQKVLKSQGSFSDALKGCSLLATEEQYIGARAMAWNSIHHLLLDEFQDTSRLQWLIFEKISQDLLSGKTLENVQGPHKSVFIVGDKKQSIYRFREAAPEVLDMAKDSLKTFGVATYGMSSSFRSSNMVLELVNDVFNKGNLIRDFPQHSVANQVQISNPEKSQYGSIAIYPPCVPAAGVDVNSHQLEAQLVAQHIKACVEGNIPMAVLDHKTNTWRSPRYSDFLILYVNTTHSAEFETALRDIGIPSRKEESKGFFGRSEIKDLNALVTWLVWPADLVALCTVLRSPICALSDMALQNLLQTKFGEKSDDVFIRLETAEPAIYTMLNHIRQAHIHQPLTSVISYLITHHRLLDRYEQAYGPFEGPLARANILKWVDLVRSAAQEDAISANTWLQAINESEEEDETGNASIASNSVSLMTIHKSKGLEFPCVILTGAEEDWHRKDRMWIKDSRPGKECFWFIGKKDARPENLGFIQELLDYSEEESRSEKARLLYVALTRATHHIVITGNKAPPRTKAKKGAEEQEDEHLNTETEAPESFFSLLWRCLSTYQAPMRTALSEQGFLLHHSLPFMKADSSASSIDSTHTRLPSSISLNLKATSRPPLKILSTTRSATKISPSHDDSPDSQDSPQLVHKVPKALGSLYGTLVHKMIENHVHSKNWSQLRYEKFLRLSEPTFQLSDKETQDFIKQAQKEVEQLLASDVWRDLIKNSQTIDAEVPLVSIDGSEMTTGKIDLLIKTNDGKYKIIDFKTIPFDTTQARAIADKLGYTQQVQTYCHMVERADGSVKETAEGYILFTDPILLLQV